MKQIFIPKLGYGHSNISKQCQGCASGDAKNHGARIVRKKNKGEAIPSSAKGTGSP